jgi:hypothetical protein
MTKKIRDEGNVIRERNKKKKGYRKYIWTLFFTRMVSLEKS